MRRAALLCVLFSILAADAQAATRYISPSGSDSAACSQAAPCASFGRAYAVAAAGDVVEVGAGTYGPQSVPSGSKAVTFHGQAGNKVRQVANQAANVTFDGIDADAGGQKLVAFYNAGVANVTFRHGAIGNVVDDKGALVDGDNMVFDDVVFHDVVQQGADVHNECMFIMVPEGLVLRNSIFRNCATMDVNMNWPGYWSPPPPAYGHVTIENNVFGHSTNGSGWHSYGFVLGGTGPNSGVPACATGQKGSVYLRGWRVVNNTFENAVIVGDGNNGCGDATNVWANNIGGGWECMGGVTFAANIGTKCATTDKAATVAPSWFTNPGAWDFHLTAGGAPIGAASPTYAPATDRDGKLRDSTPDTGAYEYGPGGSGLAGTVPGQAPIPTAPGSRPGAGGSTPGGGATDRITFGIRSARLRSATICRRARRGCPSSTSLVVQVAGASRVSARLERIRPGRRAKRVRAWTFAARHTSRIPARGLARGRYRLLLVAVTASGKRSKATIVRLRVR